MLNRNGTQETVISCTDSSKNVELFSNTVMDDPKSDHELVLRNSLYDNLDNPLAINHVSVCVKSFLFISLFSSISS